MIPSDTPKCLSAREAAALLGVSAKMLERWRGTGAGPPYLRLGHRTVRYAVRDLEAFIASRRRASTADPGPIEAPRRRARTRT